MNVLVIGGTSGLGLEIAKSFCGLGNKVIVTGRRDFNDKNLTYEPFDLAAPNLLRRVNKLVTDLPRISVLVYAAGFHQTGRVTDLTEQQIEEMIDVGCRGLIYFMKSILGKQTELDELITITSTSQWVPRNLEPVYNFVKAGEGHFSNSMAEDGRIKKVLVVGPSGMKSGIWRGLNIDTSTMLEPAWVANEIMKLRGDTYRYKFSKILREPPRVEVVEAS